MSARSYQCFAGVLLAAVAATGVDGVASAATTNTPTGTAEIRSAHLSPDTPGVDIYLTAFAGGTTTLWVPGETYGGVSKYVPVKAGTYTVSMRPHGAPVSQQPMLTWTLQAAAGRAYTAAAVGTGTARKGAVLDDDLTPPAPGKARVRLIQAASVAPKATVVAVNGPVVAKDASFATATGYAQIPAGTWPLQARSDGTPVLTTSGSVSVASGSVTSLLLLDKPGGGLILRTALDAAGAARMPSGAVPAGGGGTATSFAAHQGASPTAWYLAGLALLAAMMLGLAGLQRLPLARARA
ncbi:MAG: DUF4397 domain-containing protein [Actinomycetota bacterium]|nr:DUF4397 domain-containing protein [Actinomycetota bacterium]